MLMLAFTGVICALFIILTFITYSNTRKAPGDIILAISISDLILCLHWISSSVYAIKYDRAPNPTDLFCTMNSIFSTFSVSAEFMYQCCFCLYLILTIRHFLKGTVFKQKIFHIFCFGMTTIVVLVVWVFHMNGLSQFGTCSLKINDKFPIFALLILLIYLFLSWYAIYYFKKNVPNNDKFKKIREEFLKYYFNYVVSTSTIWSVVAISTLIASLNCTNFQQPFLNIFLTLGNTAKICSPIVLSILRYKEPTIHKKVKSQLAVIKRFFCIQSE